MAKIKVKKGQTIYAYGFGGGKYIFANEQGSIFYCNMTRTGKKSCVYDNSMYYTPEEAQLYVNDKGMSSKTGSFVWVNTYSQKFYAVLGAHVSVDLGICTLNLWGRNLTDTNYNTFAFSSKATGKEVFMAQRGNPIQLGCDINIHF